MSITHKLLRFGVFELNLNTEEVRKSGTIIKLAPQPFQLLALLATHAGQVVTREEIKQKVWGEETYVDFEQGMNHCIKQIRTVLGDNADNPLYVETLPRRGYRFLAPVVSKNVWAPVPTIIKSLSGVQTGVLEAMAARARVGSGAQGTPSEVAGAASRNEAAPNATVAGTNESGPPNGVIQVHSTQAVAHEENPAPRDRVTSATAVAEALTPEIDRLRMSLKRTRQVLVCIAVVLAVLVAGILYWQLHRSH